MTHMTGKARVGVALGRGLLLTLGLYGALFSFLSVFPLHVDDGTLLWALLALAVAATVLFSLPAAPMRLGLSLVWLGVVAVLVWRQFTLLRAALLRCGELVGAVFAKKIGYGLVAPHFPDYTDGLSLVEERAGCTLLCLLVLALLALGLGWAVVRRGAFWWGLWFTCPFLLAALVITLTPDWLPLAALLLFYLTTLLTRSVAKADPRGAARLTALLLPTGALLLGLIALLLPPERYQGAAWVQEARAATLDTLTQAGSQLASGRLPGGYSGLSGTSVEVNLDHAGPLRYAGATVLRVESEITGHIYLRGFSAGVYENGGWEQLDEDIYRGMREGWSLPLPPWSSIAGDSQLFPGIGEAQPLNFPALADRGSPTRRFTIESIGPTTGYVYTPYQLTTTPERMAGAEFVGDAYLRRGAGVRRYVLYARPEAAPHHGGRLESDLAEAERNYATFVAQHYLDVPEELSALFATLIDREDYTPLYSISDGDVRYGHRELTRPEMARMVADLLAQRTHYDAETPYTPEGEDFVAYFLTESQQGYCMHYASAATLMLRWLGIPARYTAGYTADVKAGQTADVTDEKAHAWVEIYMDGYGWHPVEVTPGFAGQTAQSAMAPAERPTPTPDHTPPPAVSQPPTPSPVPTAPTAGEGAPDIDWSRLFDPAWLLPPAALYLLWRLGKARLAYAQNRRRRRFYADDVNRAVIHMYLYSTRLLRYHRGEDMAPYAEALGQKAKFSTHTLTEDERRKMLGYTTGLGVRTYYLVGPMHRIFLRYVLGLC